MLRSAVVRPAREWSARTRRWRLHSAASTIRPASNLRVVSAMPCAVPTVRFSARSASSSHELGIGASRRIDVADEPCFTARCFFTSTGARADEGPARAVAILMSPAFPHGDDESRSMQPRRRRSIPPCVASLHVQLLVKVAGGLLGGHRRRRGAARRSRAPGG